MTLQEAKALIGLCIDEGLKQGVLKNRGEFEELFDYLDKYFARWGADHFRDLTKKVDDSSEIPNDLKEAAREYAFNNAEDGGEVLPRHLGFIAGAKWMAENLKK